MLRQLRKHAEFHKNLISLGRSGKRSGMKLPLSPIIFLEPLAEIVVKRNLVILNLIQEVIDMVPRQPGPWDLHLHFFDSYIAAPRSTLGLETGDLSHPMFIYPWLLFYLVMSFGSALSWAPSEGLNCINREPGSLSQWFTVPKVDARITGQIIFSLFFLLEVSNWDEIYATDRTWTRYDDLKKIRKWGHSWCSVGAVFDKRPQKPLNRIFSRPLLW